MLCFVHKFLQWLQFSIRTVHLTPLNNKFYKVEVSDIQPTGSGDLVSRGFLLYFRLFRVRVHMYSLCKALLSDVMGSILDFLFIFTLVLIVLQDLGSWPHSCWY